MISGAAQECLSYEDYVNTIDCINRMKVPQVKDVARCLSLPVSGRKQEIIDRIIGYYEQGKDLNDQVRLKAIRTVVLKELNNDPLPMYNVLYDAINTGAFNFIEGLSQYQNRPRVHQASSKSSSAKRLENQETSPYRGHVLYFQESPFYKLKMMIHGGPQIALPSKVRAVCNYNFILNEVESSLLNSSDRIQLYLLCGVCDSDRPSTSSALLQFPIPLELHVNGHHLKENVKGIKGKPGTARPANITPYILHSPELNKAQMVYAGSNQLFLFYAYLVEKISAEELIKEVESQPHIDRAATVLSIQQEYSNETDDDVVIDTRSISLRCILTYARMKYPTKSIHCDHLQCFDGLSFLQLQEQVPSWTCPICSNKINLSQLAISDYYVDILEKTTDDVENVIINRDGSWSIPENTPDSKKDTPALYLEKNTDVGKEEGGNTAGPSLPDIEVISIDSKSDEEDYNDNDNNNDSFEALVHQSNSNEFFNNQRFENPTRNIDMAIPSDHSVNHHSELKFNPIRDVSGSKTIPSISVRTDQLSNNHEYRTNSNESLQGGQVIKDIPGPRGPPFITSISPIYDEGRYNQDIMRESVVAQPVSTQLHGFPSFGGEQSDYTAPRPSSNHEHLQNNIVQHPPVFRDPKVQTLLFQGYNKGRTVSDSNLPMLTAVHQGQNSNFKEQNGDILFVRNVSAPPSDNGFNRSSYTAAQNPFSGDISSPCSNFRAGYDARPQNNAYLEENDHLERTMPPKDDYPTSLLLNLSNQERQKLQKLEQSRVHEGLRNQFRDSVKSYFEQQRASLDNVIHPEGALTLEPSHEEQALDAGDYTLPNNHSEENSVANGKVNKDNNRNIQNLNRSLGLLNKHEPLKVSAVLREGPRGNSEIQGSVPQKERNTQRARTEDLTHVEVDSNSMKTTNGSKKFDSANHTSDLVAPENDYSLDASIDELDRRNSNPDHVLLPRYSLSAFDIALKAQKSPPQKDSATGASKAHAASNSEPEAQNKTAEYTPLKNKFNDIQLEMMDKKRSLSNSSGGRTWNKRMNT